MSKMILVVLITLLTGCQDKDGEEGRGVYKNFSHHSYYVPGEGTVNIHHGQPPNQATGSGFLSEDIVIISDIGNSVDYISSDGSTKWRKPVGGRSLHEWNSSSLSFVSGYSVIVLDKETGKTLDSFSPLGAPLGDFQKVDGGYVATKRTSGKGTVVLLDEEMNVVWSNPHTASYPRSAIKMGDVIVVADTFGHRVYGVDINTNEMVFEEDEYFPNQVLEVEGGVLVTGEHSNRVYTLNTETGVRTPVAYCNHTPFNNMYSTTQEIKHLEYNTHSLLKNPSAFFSKSVCAGDLYSPNGAIKGEASYFIASTDDGAVLEVDEGGNVLAEVKGFNNPVNVLTVK